MIFMKKISICLYISCELFWFSILKRECAGFMKSIQAGSAVQIAAKAKATAVFMIK